MGGGLLIRSMIMSNGLLSIKIIGKNLISKKYIYIFIKDLCYTHDEIKL